MKLLYFPLDVCSLCDSQDYDSEERFSLLFAYLKATSMTSEFWIIKIKSLHPKWGGGRGGNHCSKMSKKPPYWKSV